MGNPAYYEWPAPNTLQMPPMKLFHYRLRVLSLAVALVLPRAVMGANPFGMSPPATAQIVEAAAAAQAPITKGAPAAPQGPIEANWDSVRENYKVPQWFIDGKFGVFMHWGLYSVPAYHNEWYEKHMYAAFSDWHAMHFGPQDQFGYKDFIPMFTCAKFNPDDWAALFKAAGARYVVPSAEHHDGFSLWNSDLNRWNAYNMGPKRDLIGELAVAVRKQGLKFGVSNHSIEHYTFINPKPGLKTDLDDPRYADFYWTQHSDANVQKFLELWVAKNMELIDKYKIDLLWFDNGVNPRLYDPVKLKVEAYYYNRAKEWGKEVTLSTKDSAYLAGSVLDFEKVGRAPKDQILQGAWQTDDPIGSTWGYTSDMKISGANAVLTKLVDIVSEGGNYLLNLSPKADGTFTDAQRETLLGVGKWLGINGDAIYGTHTWTQPVDDAGGSGCRFTVKRDALYAIELRPAKGAVVIKTLSAGKTVGTVTGVTMLGNTGSIQFTQDAEGLTVTLPDQPPSASGFALKITGLKLNPPGLPVPAVTERGQMPAAPPASASPANGIPN
jgi:alpha-L-fucosidase